MEIAKGFNINSIDYANQGNSIIGIRGSGKTYTASKIAEELMGAGIPIIVFDPTGVWQNLRYGINNKKGFPIVVAGGLNGDIILTDNNATKIVDAALKQNISLIIDLQGKATSTKGKWLRIVAECVEYLMEHNQEHGLRHIFIEEAAEFIPQRPNPGGALTYSRIESMARMGRNYGIGYTLINQRAEEIAKAIFEISELVLVHRQSGKNSLKSIKDWLNYKGLSESNIVNTLHKLDNGECWAIDNNGEKLINILPKKTFHPDPKKGYITAPKNNLVDVSEFIKNINSLISTETALKTTIKELPKEEKLALQNKIKFLEAELIENKKMIKLLTEKLNTINSLSVINRIELNVKQEIIVEKPIKEINHNSTIKKSSSGQARILNVCASFHPNYVTKTRIGLIANLSPNSGSFNTYLSNLKREGLIESNGQSLKITDVGLNKVDNIESLPSGEELISMWCSHIGSGSGASRILRYLCEIYPNEKHKNDIGVAVDLSASSGSFNTYLSTLKRNDLIIANKQFFKASPDFFN